jgi:outer membrane protein
MYGERFLKVIGIFLFMVTGGFLTGRVYSADIKIGSVDMARAVNECNAGKEAKKALTNEVEKFQRLIVEKQKELQDTKELLERQGLMLSPEARVAKEREYQSKLRDFQRWGEDNQNEINQKRMEMERTISSGLQKVAQRLGAEEGYTLILEKNENIVLFNSRSTDITDRVIKAYDTQKK